MRLQLAFVTCALLTVAGCAQPQRADSTLAGSRWQRLCRHMRPAHRPLVDAARRPVDPRADSIEQLSDAARHVENAVVRIQTTGESDLAGAMFAAASPAISGMSGGTGVVIDGRGLVLTNAHVVSHAGRVIVHFRDGASQEAVAVAVDEELDLAVIRLPYCQVSSLTPQVAAACLGAPVVAVSRACPLGRSSTEVGVVTCCGASLQGHLDPARGRDYSHLIESTARIEPGYSGGPLLDARGALVGLNVAVAGIRDDGRWRGYAIPFNERTMARVVLLIARTGFHSPR